MDDGALMLPVTYRGQEYAFPFRVVPQGFTMRYTVLVGDVEVVYERDDAGELRALIYNQDEITGKLPERGLLEAISAVIVQLTG
jgi:hypothetical protein